MLRTLFFLFLCLVVIDRMHAQNPRIILHSDSSTIDIRDGENFIKAAWTLEPQVNPDVYNTPNTIVNKRVNFITNRDSATITVEPGREYELVILLRDKDSCHIKISPSYGTRFLPWAQPKSHSKGFIMVVGIITMIGAVILAVPKKALTQKLLLSLGMLSVGLFWISLMLGGIIHQNYEHFRMEVSQLGAIGTGSEFFMSLATWCIGSGVFAFSIGLLRFCKRKKISFLPVLALIPLSMSFCLLSFFPLGHKLHAIIGSIGLSFILSPVLALIFWRNKLGSAVQIVSIISIFFLLLIFLRFIPTIQNSFGGLVQRSFHAGWTLWIFGISMSALKKYSQ